MLVEKYGWAIQKSLFAETNQDSTFSHTRENSKMFNITLKYFSFFNNKPPASWVRHITRDILTCYSCSYYSSMIRPSLKDCFHFSFRLLCFENCCECLPPIIYWKLHKHILRISFKRRAPTTPSLDTLLALQQTIGQSTHIIYFY